MPIYPESTPIEARPPQGESFGSRLKKAFGPLAVVGVVIAKFFVKLKFLIFPLLKFLPIILKSGGTMLFSIWIYATIFGWPFAVGFVLLLFVHECGHLIVARKFGLKVSAPVFIPFMGAFILLKDAPRNAWMEACVGIGGPMLGGLGALACNCLGETLNAPQLIALASSGYFLNLFNLLPVGFLDGGRIVTALSRWLWLPGFFLLIWFGFQYPNFIVWLMVILSVPRVWSLFRKRTEEERRYFEVTRAQRWTMSFLYFGLIAVLALGMHIAHNELADRGYVPHTGQRQPAAE
jgi:Zn-dependent protease